MNRHPPTAKSHRAYGTSKSTLYAMIQQKSFPSSILLGRRTVAWLKPEVEEWMSGLIWRLGKLDHAAGHLLHRPGSESGLKSKSGDEPRPCTLATVANGVYPQTTLRISEARLILPSCVLSGDPDNRSNVA